MKSQPIEEYTGYDMARFWSKVKVQALSACWPWQAYIDPAGYGRFRLNQKVHYAHRLAYASYFHSDEPNDETKQIDHLCRNRACQNPTHMEIVTPQINSLRGQTLARRESSKTHCPQGHPYSGDNLYLKPRPNGRFARICLTCRRAQQRVLNAKYRAK